MLDALTPAHEALLEWWAVERTGIKTRSVTAAEINQLQERYGITLPPQFRSYLSNASPVNDPAWDNELTNWWPFESLQTVAEGYEHEVGDEVAPYRDKLVLFADYSIWCWGWAINCVPGADYGKVAVIGDKDRFVAESFDHFVSRYIADDSSVFP